MQIYRHDSEKPSVGASNADCSSKQPSTMSIQKTHGCKQWTASPSLQSFIVTQMCGMRNLSGTLLKILSWAEARLTVRTNTASAITKEKAHGCNQWIASLLRNRSWLMNRVECIIYNAWFWKSFRAREKGGQLVETPVHYNEWECQHL